MNVMTSQDLVKYNIPEGPGVYFFKKGKEILYIGRATSLSDRVRSYFSNDLIKTRGPILVDMVTKAESLTWQESGSVLEAIILEANLIKEHQPIYNTKEKDNRSFNYIVITDEEYPRVLMARGRNIEKGEVIKETGTFHIKEVFGPYPQGSVLRELLKIVRKIFPFRSKCIPNSGKPCFDKQIGLCPGVCTGEIDTKEYSKTIKRIIMLLRGQIGSLKSALQKEMSDYAKNQSFEKAGKIKKIIFSLEHIRDISLIKDDVRRSANETPYRIEAYDVAHTSGKDTIGVMVVVEDGELTPSKYRSFIIKGKGNDDVSSLKEILTRRFNHPEWGIPDLIVVDGGTAQKNIAEKTILDLKISIPIVSVVKDERHKAREILGKGKEKHEQEALILLANTEAHRFAVNKHSKRRNKGFFTGLQ
jgi:excinuclease ABC subunit C